MLTVFTFISGFTLGTVFGVLCMAVCATAKDGKDDDYIEWKD